MIDTCRSTFARLVLAIVLTLAGCGGGGGPATAPSVPQNPAGVEALRAAAPEAQTSAATVNESVRASFGTVVPASITGIVVTAAPPNTCGLYSGTLQEARGAETPKTYPLIVNLVQEVPSAPNWAFIGGSFGFNGSDYGFEGKIYSNAALDFTIKDFHGRPAIARATAKRDANGGFEIKGSAKAAATGTQPTVTLDFTVTEMNGCRR